MLWAIVAILIIILIGVPLLASTTFVGYRLFQRTGRVTKKRIYLMFGIPAILLVLLVFIFTITDSF